MAEKKNIQPAVRNLAAGDVLFREGEVGDYAYQIVKGKIEVCKFNGDEYVTLSILENGALFGEMALILNQNRSATIISNKPTELISINKEDKSINFLEIDLQNYNQMINQIFD